MIKLEEKQTKKLPGKTSIFVDFEYKAELVDVMHQVQYFTRKINYGKLL